MENYALQFVQVGKPQHAEVIRRWIADIRRRSTDTSNEVERLRTALRTIVDDQDDCVSPGMKALARKALDP